MCTYDEDRQNLFGVGNSDGSTALTNGKNKYTLMATSRCLFWRACTYGHERFVYMLYFLMLSSMNSFITQLELSLILELHFSKHIWWFICALLVGKFGHWFTMFPHVSISPIYVNPSHSASRCSSFVKIQTIL